MNHRVLVGLIGLLFVGACSPSPEQYAAATATVMRAQNVATQDAYFAQATATVVAINSRATATAVAINARATETAVVWQAQATAVHWDIAVQATRTAVPYDAALVATRTDTENTKAWLGVISWVAVLGFGGLIILALRAIMMREARTIRRDTSGQLPVLMQEGVITNPARMLGSTVVAPRRDPLWHIYRAVRWLRTGELPALPAPQVVETDHGASPEHLLEVAREELRATAVAAMFQRGVSNADRRERIQLVQETGGALGTTQPIPQRTQIVANGSDAVSIIMRMIRPQLPSTPPPALPDATDPALPAAFKEVDGASAEVPSAPVPTEHEAD